MSALGIKKILLICFSICACAGIGIGIYFAVKKDDIPKAKARPNPDTSTNPVPAPGASNNPDSAPAPATPDSSQPAGFVDPAPHPVADNTPTSPGEQPATSPPIAHTIPPNLPEPSKEDFILHALAIGDWGSTPNKPSYPGSCCNRYRITGTDNVLYYKDFWAQKNIAHMLAKSARKLKPKVIIGHGDNFYWNGVGPKDVENRFHQAFESVYDQPELAGIKWISVTGNHDIAGAAYICGEEDKRWRACESKEEMLDYLNKRFDLQSNYVSPHQNRWYMPSHYFKYNIREGDVSIDIFNVDTNFADSHGARQICCQCWGYSKGQTLLDNGHKIDCNNVNRGDKFCMGGDVEMYDACYNTIRQWHEDSLMQTARDAKASTADWKIINSHYSPHFHMSPPKMEKWFKILRENNIQIFMNGHTHGENHDFGVFNTHFFENGAGGGIQSETSGKPPPSVKNEIQNIWVGRDAPYGFFELSASKYWMKMQFVTFASDWRFSLDPTQIHQGSNKVDHCWYVPIDGSYGKPCDK